MDIDVTFVIQFGLLIFGMVTLNGLVLKPFLEVIQERESKTEGANEQVEVLTRMGDADRAIYQARMREARVDADAKRDAFKTEGRESERQLLAQVRAEIADSLNKARQQVVDAEQKARSELASETQPLAQQLVSKVLGREVSA